jgi:hypothetical protein
MITLTNRITGKPVQVDEQVTDRLEIAADGVVTIVSVKKVFDGGHQPRIVETPTQVIEDREKINSLIRAGGRTILFLKNGSRCS